MFRPQPLYPIFPTTSQNMALRLALASTSKLSRSFAHIRTTGASAFAQNQTRSVSHYNASLAGLTEEQTEVRTTPSLSDLGLTLWNPPPFFTSSGRPFTSSLRRKLHQGPPKLITRTLSLWYPPPRHPFHIFADILLNV